VDAASERRYTGHSGQLAVMGELLLRGYNVAVPEVDTGEDVLAFRNGEEVVARIQVKTAKVRKKELRQGYVARFYIPVEQLKDTARLSLFYALAVRHRGRWAAFLVVGHRRMKELWEDQSAGRENNKGELVLRISFRARKVRCGKVSLGPYRNAWDALLPPSAAAPAPPDAPTAPSAAPPADRASDGPSPSRGGA
jgi:hypothetical protein